MKSYAKPAALLALLCALSVGNAADPKSISLPPARQEGGKPLMQALKERQSKRSFDARPLEPQVLANLLWAAAGINRPENGMRTAPSTMNWKEIEVYVVLPEGAYIYEPTNHVLQEAVSGDLRALTGKQGFVASVPVNLVYVANMNRIKNAEGAEADIYAAADAAFISQNVYLYCASEGLATVVRGLIDKPALAKALKLPESKKIIFAQSVGYPAK